MPDGATGAESAWVEKYSEDQAAQSRQILGREPEHHELRAHHDAPADGVAGDVPEAGGD